MFTLNCKGKLLVVDEPLVMGIINVTPDSFYAGSRFQTDNQLQEQAEKMLKEGADILDMGGQSTRPWSQEVSEAEEIRRVIPAIELLHKRFPEAVISIDSYRNRVTREAVDAGAAIINDISGGMRDEEILKLAGSLGIPYICMHSRGKPDTMQQNPVYKDLTQELLDFFIERKGACRKEGIKDMIIDPGLGFGKTSNHNFELLKHLAVFKMLGLPILIGCSRKGMIYQTLGITAGEALNGTTVLNTIALVNGADILRVHDVREAKEAIRLFSRYST